MFKLRFPKSLFQIKKGWFIAVDEEFKEILEYSASGLAGVIKTLNDEIEINNNHLDQFTFAELEDPSADIGVNVIYTCKVCNNPTLGFETQEQVQNHIDNCLFNPLAQKCVMCKNLKIIENPPYPRFAKEYQSVETYHAFGAYKQPYCMLKEKDINEWILHENHDDCFEFSSEPAVTETTEEFEKYVELIMSDDVYTEEVDISNIINDEEDVS